MMTGTRSASNTEPIRQTRPRTAPPARRPLLLFHLAEQGYALPLADLREIVPMALLARSACLPAVIAGFLHLAGDAIPVLRLDRLFGLPEQPLGLYTPLLLLRTPESPLALQVDRVKRIVTPAADALVPVREGDSFNSCVEGILRIDEQVVLLLSLERILLEKEQQGLAEFQDREQTRLRELEEPRS